MSGTNPRNGSRAVLRLGLQQASSLRLGQEFVGFVDQVDLSLVIKKPVFVAREK